MSDDRIIALVWVVGGLALVSSAVVRRGGGGSRWKMALLWAGIILAAWGVATIAPGLIN